MDAVPSELNLEDAALFLDVDGTLLDIAPRPAEVVVPTDLVEVLLGAEQRLGGALALLSGRRIEELDRLFSPLRLRASGAHGAEIRYEPDGASEALAPGELPPAAWRDVQHMIAGYHGTFAENKRTSIAVHYRLMRRPVEALEEELQRIVDRLGPPRVELVQGRRVFEIKLAGFDKGAALRRFMAREPFQDRKPIFIADEEIDRAGFEAALSLGGYALCVGQEVLPGLSGGFRHPSALRDWLARFAA